MRTSTKHVLSQRRIKKGTASAHSSPLSTAGDRSFTDTTTAFTKLLICKLLEPSATGCAAAAEGEPDACHSWSSISCVVRWGRKLARRGELRLPRGEAACADLWGCCMLAIRSAARCLGMLVPWPKERMAASRPPVHLITSCSHGPI